MTLAEIGYLVLGAMIGGTLGVFVMAEIVVSRDADEKEEKNG